MDNRFYDLVGQVFNRLTVTAFAGTNKRQHRCWLCRCECGGQVVVTTHELRSGHTKSCGCWGRDFPGNVTNGLRRGQGNGSLAYTVEEILQQKELSRKAREKYKQEVAARKTITAEQRLERRRESDRRRYQNHRLEILARKKLLFINEREKLLKRRHEFYLRHAERERAYQRAWYERNTERAAARSVEYAKRHPEIFRAAANRRRAKIAAADGSFTEAEWLALCVRYGQLCGWCRKPKVLHSDHIVPLCKGGSNFITNIQPLCKSCNSKKALKMMYFPPPKL